MHSAKSNHPKHGNASMKKRLTPWRPGTRLIDFNDVPPAQYGEGIFKRDSTVLNVINALTLAAKTADETIYRLKQEQFK
jgi:hypothetical protein